MQAMTWHVIIGLKIRKVKRIMHTIRNVYFKVFFMLKSRFKNMIIKHKGTNNYLYNKNVF
jgi:hypothetical protein